MCKKKSLISTFLSVLYISSISYGAELRDSDLTKSPINSIVPNTFEIDSVLERKKLIKKAQSMKPHLSLDYRKEHNILMALIICHEEDKFLRLVKSKTAFYDALETPYDEGSYYLIHNAAEQGLLNVLEYLCKVPTMLHKRSSNGHSILHAAVSEGNVEAVKFLCENYPELIFKRDMYRRTASEVVFCTPPQNYAEIQKILEEKKTEYLSNESNLSIISLNQINPVLQSRYENLINKHVGKNERVVAIERQIEERRRQQAAIDARNVALQAQLTELRGQKATKEERLLELKGQKKAKKERLLELKGQLVTKKEPVLQINQDEYLKQANILLELGCYKESFIRFLELKEVNNRKAKEHLEHYCGLTPCKMKDHAKLHSAYDQARLELDQRSDPVAYNLYIDGVVKLKSNAVEGFKQLLKLESDGSKDAASFLSHYCATSRCLLNDRNHKNLHTKFKTAQKQLKEEAEQKARKEQKLKKERQLKTNAETKTHSEETLSLHLNSETDSNINQQLLIKNQDEEIKENDRQPDLLDKAIIPETSEQSYQNNITTTTTTLITPVVNLSRRNTLNSLPTDFLISENASIQQIVPSTETTPVKQTEDNVKESLSSNGNEKDSLKRKTSVRGMPQSNKRHQDYMKQRPERRNSTNSLRKPEQRDDKSPKENESKSEGKKLFRTQSLMLPKISESHPSCPEYKRLSRTLSQRDLRNVGDIQLDKATIKQTLNVLKKKGLISWRESKIKNTISAKGLGKTTVKKMTLHKHSKNGKKWWERDDHIDEFISFVTACDPELALEVQKIGKEKKIASAAALDKSSNKAEEKK